jgi:uncharacterized protein Usg
MEVPEMHAYITHVADRAARREVEALADFYGVGSLIVSGEIAYDTARDDMVAAFKVRDMNASTAKVYVSQGYALAQLFDTLDEVLEFADEECKGSRSLKRIYDATRVRETADESGEGGESEGGEGETRAMVDVILANLAQLTDTGEIARVRDAAAAMLAPVAVAI